MIIYNFKNYNFFLLLKMGFKNMSFNVIIPSLTVEKEKSARKPLFKV